MGVGGAKDMHAVLDVRSCARWCYMRKARTVVGKGEGEWGGVASREGIWETGWGT